MFLTVTLFGQIITLDVKYKEVSTDKPSYCSVAKYTAILPTLSNFNKLLRMSFSELDKTMKAYGYNASHKGDVINYTNGGVCAEIAKFKSWIFYKIADGSIVMIIDDDSPLLQHALIDFYTEMRPYYFKHGTQDAWSVKVDGGVLGIKSDDFGGKNAIGLNAIFIKQ
jgi:hypothetical protein